MKARTVFMMLVLLCFVYVLPAQQYRMSDGLYRIPYGNATSVEVVTNVWNHSPLGCFDMYGKGGTDYNIVAAAGGWIRAIRDFNDVACGGSSCCNDKNNYIILEHQNGEWSSYIHLRHNSISDLGHAVGNWVEAGTVLGLEGDVGCATGSHLHLEVARPYDPTDAFDAYDGVLRRHGALLNPVFCNVGTGYIQAGSTYTAGTCNYNCPADITQTGSVTNQVLRADNTITSTNVFNAAGTGMYRAGTQILFTPGFTATQGVMFTAQIKTCNEQE
jgi:Peptidase family M23